MLMRVRSIGTFITRTITTKKGESMELLMEQCDLWLPGKRHPVDHERKVNNQNEGLTVGQDYFIAGDSFGLNNYGSPEIKRYDMQYIPFVSVVEYINELANDSQSYLEEVS